jgi:hypothetical protein
MTANVMLKGLQKFLPQLHLRSTCFTSINFTTTQYGNAQCVQRKTTRPSAAVPCLQQHRHHIQAGSAKWQASWQRRSGTCFTGRQNWDHICREVNGSQPDPDRSPPYINDNDHDEEEEEEEEVDDDDDDNNNNNNTIHFSPSLFSLDSLTNKSRLSQQ